MNEKKKQENRPLAFPPATSAIAIDAQEQEKEINWTASPYFINGKSNGQILKEYLENNLEYDDEEKTYLFEGKWVRIIKDQYGSIDSLERKVSPTGESIDLKTVRNPETHEIERLIEMTEEETQRYIEESRE